MGQIAFWQGFPILFPWDRKCPGRYVKIPAGVMENPRVTVIPRCSAALYD